MRFLCLSLSLSLCVLWCCRAQHFIGVSFFLASFSAWLVLGLVGALLFLGRGLGGRSGAEVPGLPRRKGPRWKRERLRRVRPGPLRMESSPELRPVRARHDPDLQPCCLHILPGRQVLTWRCGRMPGVLLPFRDPCRLRLHLVAPAAACSGSCSHLLGRPVSRPCSREATPSQETEVGGGRGQIVRLLSGGAVG